MLDRAGRLPMHRQLSQRLREAILARQFPPGTRLPSTRTLAAELGVSRTTALAAYEQLRDEGYPDGQVGAGTTVADLTGPLPARASVSPAAPFPARAEVSPGGGTSGPVGAGAAAAASRWRLRPETGPGSEWPRALPAGPACPTRSRGSCGPGPRPGGPGARSAACSATSQDLAGYWPLREAIAAYLGMARGVRQALDQVLVVSGAQAGIDLAARLLLDPGDLVWVEDLGYYGACGALIGAGLAGPGPGRRRRPRPGRGLPPPAGRPAGLCHPPTSSLSG